MTSDSDNGYDQDAAARVLAAAGVTAPGLGRQVRIAWTGWARRQPDAAAHPNWLVPYDFLLSRDREADDEIGTRLFTAGWAAHARQPQPARPAAPDPMVPALARALLQLADDAQMPDAYWQADSRMVLARRILGVPDTGRSSHAHLWAKPLRPAPDGSRP
jgi:hypothetical protein